MQDASTVTRPTSRVLTLLRGALGWALLAAGLWFVWPSTLGGCTTLTVVSGHSMEPTYYTGDLVVSRCGTPHVGDVVVYKPSELGGSARIIHRIIGGDGTSGWEMKGDNNSFVDPFVPTNADVVGVALVHLPKVGRVSVLVLNPWVWVAVILAAAVLLIWPAPEEDEQADADGSEVGDRAAPESGTESHGAPASASEPAREPAADQVEQVSDGGLLPAGRR